MGGGHRVFVGTSWLTYCNGLWHMVFLAEEEAGHFGPCNCRASSPWNAVVLELEDAIDKERDERASGQL